MSIAVSDGFPLPSENGIGSILSSEYKKPDTAPSLRRTLSADMSSKKWSTQNRFHPLKKVASYEGFPIVTVTDSSSSSSSDEEAEEQEREQTKKKLETPSKFDIWNSICSQKVYEASKSSPNSGPYVHPLVKSWAKSLTEKSLEICTESLGSETGSDGFSSYPSEDDKEEEPDPADNEVQESCFASKSSLPQSFPPPLPSLSIRKTPSIQMRSHRKNGRLVVEAVAVSSYKNFHALRQGGRLLLSFEERTHIENDLKEETEKEENFNEQEGLPEVEIEEIEKEDRISEQLPKLPTGLIKFHRLALVISKPLLGFTNRTPIRSPNLQKSVDLKEVRPFPQPLPAATGKSTVAFNTYQYSWRKKSTAGVAKNLNLQREQKLLVTIGNKSGYLLPPLKGCKEAPRTLLLWEPCCIATS